MNSNMNSIIQNRSKLQQPHCQVHLISIHARHQHKHKQLKKQKRKLDNSNMNPNQAKMKKEIEELTLETPGTQN